jgi:hypothetical protein
MLSTVRPDLGNASGGRVQAFVSYKDRFFFVAVFFACITASPLVNIHSKEEMKCQATTKKVK